MKINRQVIYNKCNGHCAYCGKEITIKQMQIDHIEPHWHTMTEQEAQRFNIKKGSHEMNNLNPSCARCNKWKSTYSLEQFRGVVQRSIDRMERDTPNFRLAKDYGLITITNQPVVFYFERTIDKPNELILKV
jgi:5-methylcytosine-specific restriction endonuclease McrA